MLERFVDAGAVFLLSYPAAGGADGFLHFANGIGRTGREGRVTAIEHRDVVVMIARGKNHFARDFCQAGQFFKGRALVIIGVAEAQIHGVSLVMELRLVRPGLVMNFVRRSISSSLVAIRPAGSSAS